MPGGRVIDEYPPMSSPSPRVTNLFAFRSFRTRLLVFLLALLLPVLLGIYAFVNRENNTYTTDTINSYLELGADVSILPARNTRTRC